MKRARPRYSFELADVESITILQEIAFIEHLEEIEAARRTE